MTSPGVQGRHQTATVIVLVERGTHVLLEMSEYGDPSVRGSGGPGAPGQRAPAAAMDALRCTAMLSCRVGRPAAPSCLDIYTAVAPKPFEKHGPKARKAVSEPVNFAKF